MNGRVHALIGALWQVLSHPHTGHEQHDGPKPSITCYLTIDPIPSGWVIMGVR